MILDDKRRVEEIRVELDSIIKRHFDDVQNCDCTWTNLVNAKDFLGRAILTEVSEPIQPNDVVDYAKDRGWTLVEDGVPQQLFVLNNPTCSYYRQIVLPRDATSPDYMDALRIAIAKLANGEDRPESEVEVSLRGVSSMRVLRANQYANSPWRVNTEIPDGLNNGSES